MKNSVLLLIVCFLLVFLLELSLNFENAFAQKPTIDCEGTLRAWRMDPRIGPQIADQYYCPHPDRPPVLRPKKSPTPETPTINRSALEAKYFAEADRKGWTQIRIEFGSKKRYYKKENGNWVRTNAEYRTPEDQRKDQQKKERWAKEERERKRLLKKRQGELEREKELFELGKSDLLNTLKGPGGEQGLALKPAPIEQENGVWSDPIVVDLSDKKSDIPILLRPIVSLPSGEAWCYLRPNELREIQNKASVTSVIRTKVLEELIEKLKDKLKGISGAKGLIEAYERVKKARGILKAFAMGILEGDMKLISQAAKCLGSLGSDCSSLIDKTYLGLEKNKEKIDNEGWKFLGEDVKNKI